MRIQSLLFIFLVSTSAASSSPSPEASCQHTATQFNCVKYIRNYDADTITFNIPDVHPLIGEKINIRVLHVDTPEIRGHLPCERESARNAKRLVENLLKRANRIDLKNIGRDKYFRILADVYIDGKDLKDYLLKNNLAYRYEGDTKQKMDWCKRVPAAIQ